MASTSGLGEPHGLVVPQRNKPSTDHSVQPPKRPRDSPDRDVTALKRPRPNSDDDDDESMDCKVLDSPDLYTIAWIAALSIEAAAATAILDEEHGQPKSFCRHPKDDNVYEWGRMGEHNVVITSLPAGIYGTTSASTTTFKLLSSLPGIKIGLMVGVGGGIARPDDGRDIRLGDVVISQPDGTTGGVCQYDLFKAKSGDVHERKGFLLPPPTVLLNAVAAIQRRHIRKGSKVPMLLRRMLKNNPQMAKDTRLKPGFVYQGVANDRLFKPTSTHAGERDCTGCRSDETIERADRDSTDPEFHYGIIASGNTLIKDATARDRIIKNVGEDCLCVEMEAAGLMNNFPCLVVRGICDYADSHKNDRWQPYASATAAAYAKELLGHIPPAAVEETKKAVELLNSVKKRLDEMQQATLSTNTTVITIESNAHTEKVKKWLSPVDPSTNANHASNLHHPGTGAWLLESDVFKEWESGSRRHMWLHGFAGCGKTVLSATILNHLTKKDDSHLVLRFFFDFSDKAKQTVNSMLRTFAFQVYQCRLGSPQSANLDTSFQKHQQGLQQPSQGTLSDVICSMLSGLKDVVILLDAMDESTTRRDLNLWIKDVVSKPELKHVRLMLTSRPELDFAAIPSLIGKDGCISLDNDSSVAVNADIRSFVTARLENDEFRCMRLDEDLVQQIRSRVGDGAKGMFRWAACQMDTLAKCLSPAAVEEALRTLPKDLSETYDRMIQSIPADLKADAMRLLHFLVHSFQPLELDQAIDILATHVEGESPGFDPKRRVFHDSAVLQHCPGLVSVVSSWHTKELHLAHFSVQEYLLTRTEFEITKASILITRTCLAYLTSLGYPGAGQPHPPLAKYAMRSWMLHASKAEVSEDHDFIEASLAFLQNKKTFNWVQQDDITDSNGNAVIWTPLVAACAGGFEHAVNRLLDPVNTQGNALNSALYAASLQGYKKIAKLLLGAGADVNAQGGFYGNALQAVSERGHKDVARLLLNAGADVNAQGGRYGNALQAASESGHKDVARLLLDAGADVNAQGGFYGNALQAASVYGYKNVARLLLDAGADVNAQGGCYGNALQAASEYGYKDVARLLLDAGADVNAQGGCYGNALHAASESGHKNVTRLLLDAGADVNAQGGSYGNALQAASVYGHKNVARLLLDAGADVNTQGGKHGNALQAASEGGHKDVARLLLDAGANAKFGVD
ncbi:hypothetical protein RB599_004859 [Gaeumannomyces hyphopodioides]